MEKHSDTPKESMNSAVMQSRLLEAIRKHLRARGITYSELGRMTGKSEITVKRLFAGQGLTLAKLHRIASVLKIPLSELLREAEVLAGGDAFELSEIQERTLAADFRLYSFFVFLIYRVPLAQIMSRFNIDEDKAERYLLKLDKIKVVALGRNLKFRVLIPHQFTWRKNGPIEKRIITPLTKELLKGHVADQQNAHEFFVARMTPELFSEFRIRFRKLAEELLSRSIVEESGRPDAQNVGFMLVLRPFGKPVVQHLERVNR